jgi:hypothetical protein
VVVSALSAAERPKPPRRFCMASGKLLARAFYCHPQRREREPGSASSGSPRLGNDARARAFLSGTGIPLWRSHRMEEQPQAERDVNESSVSSSRVSSLATLILLSVTLAIIAAFALLL